MTIKEKLKEMEAEKERNKERVEKWKLVLKKCEPK